MLRCVNSILIWLSYNLFIVQLVRSRSQVFVYGPIHPNAYNVLETPSSLNYTLTPTTWILALFHHNYRYYFDNYIWLLNKHYTIALIC